MLLPLLLVWLGGATSLHVALYRGRGGVNEAVAPSAGRNLNGQPGEGYYMQMAVGTPPQKLNVLVDTGSSNFAIAAAAHADITAFFNYKLSSTFRKSGREVRVPYTQGNWQGFLATDLITMPSLSNTTVQVNVAAITSSDNFFINGSHWQGILGLAYSDIARPDSSVEPLFDAWVRATNSTDMFSLQLCGTVDRGNYTDVNMGGTMVIGSIDPDMYVGDIQYAMVRRHWYYDIILTDIRVNNISLNLDCKEYNFDKTIVDSGTTNLRLPNTVFKHVTAAMMQIVNVKGKTVPPAFWSGDEILCYTTGASPWEEFPELVLQVALSNNSVVELTVSAQQYLRQTDDVYHSETHDCYKFAVSPSDSGTVLGAVVMEGFYVVFSRHTSQVGFARSTCSNSDQARVSAALPYAGNSMECGYMKPPPAPSTLVIVAYVMAGLCVLCLLPVLLMLLHWQASRCRHRHPPSDDFSGLLKDDDMDR